MRAPSHDPMKIGAVDVETFSRNLARVVEEGGRALAAYLKPREDGRGNREFADEVNEVVKTLGARRAILALRSATHRRTAGPAGQSLSRSLGLGGQTPRRRSRPRPVVTPAANDKRFSDPEWTSNQFFDFLKQAYLLTTRWANELVSDAADLDPHTRQKAEFYMRQITNALSPSNFVLTNPGAAARDPDEQRARISFAACTCSPRTSKPAAAISKSASPTRRCSRSAAILRPRPAR